MSNQPIAKTQLGRITATAWQNESDNGPWYSVALTRSYRDSSGATKSTHSMSANDLGNAILALQLMVQKLEALRGASHSPPRAASESSNTDEWNDAVPF